MMITNFFKRKHSENIEDTNISNRIIEDEPAKKKTDVTWQSQLKTVKKWIKELNIDIGYKLKPDSDIVCEIWCEICRKHSKDKSSSLVTGSTRVKKEAIIQHTRSVAHERAMGAKVAEDLTSKQQLAPLEKGFHKLDEAELIKLDKLFRTAFYLVLKERPFSDFHDLLELQNLNEASVGNAYANDKAAKNFVTVIADSYQDDLKELLQKADYFSIFCDGSTDKTETEKELIMVKVLDDFYPKLKLLKLEQPPNTKAVGILEAIDNAFSSLGLPDYKNKLVGFCSDGASVMMGERRGVIRLLKDAGNAPWILSVWCFAHRLELAVKDAFKSSYMDNVIEVLQGIFYFYKGSAKRNKCVQDIAELMADHFYKPGKADGTRWVEHKLTALTKLIHNWELIIIHFMDYIEDVSNKAEDRAKARGRLSQLRQFKLIWYLYFLKDVLTEVSKVSLLFQRDDINVSSAVTKLQCAQTALQAMMENPGPQLQEFSHDVVNGVFKGTALNNVVDINILKTQNRQILQKVIDCIDQRFSNVLADDPAFAACHIFDYKNWPSPNNGNALHQYGNEDLRQIIHHFSELLLTCGCDTVSAQVEWSELKLYVARNPHFQTVHPLAVWQHVSQEDANRHDYLNILRVIHLTSLYPLSNATCERGFSTMKRIKSDWRSRLSNKSMDMLMRVTFEGPKLIDFSPRPHVNRMWLDGQRTKRPTSLPYGPRQ